MTAFVLLPATARAWAVATDFCHSASRFGNIGQLDADSETFGLLCSLRAQSSSAFLQPIAKAIKCFTLARGLGYRLSMIVVSNI